MIPANKIKEIKESINSWYVNDDSDHIPIPLVKPLLIILLIIGGVTLLEFLSDYI